MEKSNEILWPGEGYPDDNDLQEHYTDEILEHLTRDWDHPVYPRKDHKFYDRLIELALKNIGINFKDYVEKNGYEVVHSELYYDCCNLIVHLARLLLIEREQFQNQNHETPPH